MDKIRHAAASKRDSSDSRCGETLNQNVEAGKLTPKQRDYLVRSVIGSQAIEGVDVSRDEAERWLDEVLERPTLKMHPD